MRVKWLRKALVNLDYEASSIAQDNPAAAAEFVIHLRDSALILGEQPNLGRSGRITGTRELVIARFPYILPYRVRNANVEILRVLHTARKWPVSLAQNQ